MQIYLIIFLIFAVLVAAFAVQNTMPVVVKLLLWEANLSLVLVILGSVAVGAILLFTIDTVKHIGNKREIKDMNRQIKELTKEKELLEKSLLAMQHAQADPDTETPSPAEVTTPGRPDMKSVTTLEELDRMIGNEDAVR